MSLDSIALACQYIGVSEAGRMDPRSWLARWQAAGVYGLQSRCVAVEAHGGRVVATHEHFVEEQVLIRTQWEHQFYEGGQMDVQVRVRTAGGLPPLPRIGAHMQVIAVDNIRWFGRGPHENYPDRRASADVGEWQADVVDMHTDYIFPTENGLRCDTTNLRVGDVHVSGCFHFAVSRYGYEQTASATHYHQLTPESNLHLCLDGFHMGVGGDDSWTPSVKPRYLLTESEYSWAFSLK